MKRQQIKIIGVNVILLVFTFFCEVSLSKELNIDNSIEELPDTSSASSMLNDTNLKSSCLLNGLKLYGKVKFVDSFPDFTIKYVSSFPDIKVKFVSSFPDSCGKWKVVENFPDFKVKVVTSFPDLTVKKVSSFPGMN